MTKQQWLILLWVSICIFIGWKDKTVLNFWNLKDDVTGIQQKRGTHYKQSHAGNLLISFWFPGVKSEHKLVVHRSARYYNKRPEACHSKSLRLLWERWVWTTQADIQLPITELRKALRDPLALASHHLMLSPSGWILDFSSPYFYGRKHILNVSTSKAK